MHVLFRIGSYGARAAAAALAVVVFAAGGLAQADVDKQLVKKLHEQGKVLLQKQEYEKAAATFRKLTEVAPKDAAGWQLLGYSLHAAGKLDEALPAHLRAAEFPQVASVAAYNVACVHALQGRPDQAIEWLGKAVEAGFADPEQVQGDPDFASLKDDARFQKLVQEIAVKAKAAPALKPFAQTVERRNARLAWFGKQGSPGQLAIDWSPVPWTEKYGEAVAAGKLVGKRWRFGADFWTRLDSSVDLKIGGVAVPAGYYYLTAMQRDAETFVLTLHDAGAVQKQHLDAFRVDLLQGGIDVVLAHETAGEAAAALAIELLPAKGKLGGAVLAIRFGPHLLQAKVEAALGKPAG